MEIIRNIREICRGAEAIIYRCKYFDKEAIMKVRAPKKYRHPDLDRKIRTHRTKLEARIMHDVKKYGVNAPSLYDIDIDSSSLIMEYLEGKCLRDIIETCRSDHDRKKMSVEFGKLIGRMHSGDIIHGDPTTSNTVVCDRNIYIIDFGLSSFDSTIEGKGVDVHLVRETFSSSHHEYPNLFEAFLTGYSSIISNFDEIMERVKDIERRGRYAR